MSDGRALSALNWWVEAGVDTLVGEEPRDWLKPAAPTLVPLAPVEAVPEPQAAIPDDLEAFRAWLVGDRVPLASSAPRAGPAGDPAAGLMILVDMPSPDGALMGGEAGALFDRMLGAIKRNRETIYLAPLSPTRPATGSLDPANLRALAEIARRHIGLVAPRAVLLFGDTCAKALVGSAVAGARGRWHEIHTGTGDVKALVTIRPEKLLNQPALKRLAWDDLKMLMEELEG